MGSEWLHSSKYWRLRAEEFRSKADACQFPQTRETLRDIANNYNELAQRAEQVVTLAELDKDARFKIGPRARGRGDE
ncbi:hypothetical protein AB8Z38_11580 [Bradyrhizobium sp. LLZ17]|uniref:Uncharacterized protein n=1 Tax=Bradyrhizobium sp. LLZ17 TaxID=3239388 RepID=A0AB39XR30_9BRAD